MSVSNPIYMIAALEVLDMEAFMRDYVGPLQNINRKHGVEVLAAAPEVQRVEGEYPQNLTVIMRFPSKEAQQAWYTDPDYQPLIEKRQQLTNTARSSLIALPAFIPGVKP